jgi:hypothetical protein
VPVAKPKSVGITSALGVGSAGRVPPAAAPRVLAAGVADGPLERSSLRLG